MIHIYTCNILTMNNLRVEYFDNLPITLKQGTNIILLNIISIYATKIL